MRYIIGVDVGGTNIKGVLIDQKGKVIEKIIKKTSQTKIREEIVLFIEEIIEKSKIKRRKIKGIGIGFPGIIDKKRERIDVLPNIKKFRDNDIKKYLESKTGFKIRIENDSNCAVLAESILGIGKDYENVIGLSIGTGIGGGIVINKKIYTGNRAAGEFGHLIIEENGRLCSCGNKGCLEEYISKKGIIKNAKQAGLSEKGKDLYELYELAKKGNKKALKVFRESGVYLGKGLAQITKVLDPEIIVINGGIANSGEFIFPYAEKEMKKRVFFKTDCKIKKGKLKDFAGAVGAACLWF